MLFSGWDVRLSLAGLVGVRAKLSWVARNKVYVNWVSVNFFLVSSKFPFWLRSILKKALFAFRKIEVLFFKVKLVVFKFKILVLCWRYSNSCFTFEYTYHVSVWKKKFFFSETLTPPLSPRTVAAMAEISTDVKKHKNGKIFASFNVHEKKFFFFIN